jgi:hypothetical protein
MVHAGNDDDWWFNYKTGEVEKGRKSPSMYRDGPYLTEADALRAPEIRQQRSQAWADEEAAGETAPEAGGGDHS